MILTSEDLAREEAKGVVTKWFAYLFVCTLMLVAVATTVAKKFGVVPFGGVALLVMAVFWIFSNKAVKNVAALLEERNKAYGELCGKTVRALRWNPAPVPKEMVWAGLAHLRMHTPKSYHGTAEQRTDLSTRIDEYTAIEDAYLAAGHTRGVPN